MSFEQPRTRQEEQEDPALHERLDSLENRVHELVGQTRENISRIPGGAELAETAEGQAKLLKIQESARRFNQRVLGTVALLNAPTFWAGLVEHVAKDMGASWHESLEPFVNAGGQLTVGALFVAGLVMAMRTMKMNNQADEVLDSMQHRT